jgi:O-acetyl-ADP-ribose deacetylase (regulator of RNase III)
MKVVEGDLLKLASDGVFDVIIHGCNCQCVMGAGIAKSIKAVFPEAYEADCKTKKGSRNKLGTYSSVLIGKLTIVNAYTQFPWKGRGIKVDYEAIRAVFKSIKINFSGKKIGYPMIGAGLAGGDWDVIAAIIDNELVGENHTLVKFVP